MTFELIGLSHHYLHVYYSVVISRKVYVQWKESPTITTISTTAYPIKKVDFPAITICSQGSAKDILDTALLRQFERYVKSKGKIKIKVKKEGKTGLKRRKRSTKSIVDTLNKTVVRIMMLEIYCT